MNPVRNPTTEKNQETGDGREAGAGSLHVLRHLTIAEAKLLLRDPTPVLVGMLLPTVMLLGLGALPALREPSADFGGIRFVDYWAPTALIFAMLLLAMHLPNIIAAYREQGVLRRMSTTPVHPGMVLAAQLIVVTGAILVAAALLLVSSRLVLDVPLPQQPGLFAAAFGVGALSLIALGMLIAAVAPNARVANVLAMVLYFVIMLVSGLFLPRFMLPDFVVDLGEVTPPGVQLLLDSWTGVAEPAGLSHLAQFAIMGAIAVVVAVVAARLFRWD